MLHTLIYGYTTFVKIISIDEAQCNRSEAHVNGCHEGDCK